MDDRDRRSAVTHLQRVELSRHWSSTPAGIAPAGAYPVGATLEGAQQGAERPAAKSVASARPASRSSGTPVTFLVALVLGVATWGWLHRAELPLTPEHGIGYGLGVSAGVGTLLLAVSSARKRLRFMHGWGAASQWFRAHMILGGVTPLLVLFHCKFHAGATNSAVALVSMLIVAASGFVGRYLYVHISHGLYGARATFEELHAQLLVSENRLGESLPADSRAAKRLAAFAHAARAPRRTLASRLLRLLILPLQARWVRLAALHDLHADREVAAGSHASLHPGNDHATRQRITAFVSALVREVQFSAYERLFSLWHALHVPLFVMLLLTGVLHVIAVHMY